MNAAVRWWPSPVNCWKVRGDVDPRGPSRLRALPSGPGGPTGQHGVQPGLRGRWGGDGGPGFALEPAETLGAIHAAVRGRYAPPDRTGSGDLTRWCCCWCCRCWCWPGRCRPLAGRSARAVAGRVDGWLGCGGRRPGQRRLPRPGNGRRPVPARCQPHLAVDVGGVGRRGAGVGPVCTGGDPGVGAAGWDRGRLASLVDAHPGGGRCSGGHR